MRPLEYAETDRERSALTQLEARAIGPLLKFIEAHTVPCDTCHHGRAAVVRTSPRVRAICGLCSRIENQRAYARMLRGTRGAR